ncbi:MAG: hypothetical protein IK062_05895 [Selenomonadaceae bacterium]|nr:hypothetical protein [Selenomonadaceae bacterium]
MRLLKIFPIVLILFLLPVKTFADAPDISYGRSEVNLLTGYYHLMDNVRLAVDNHGVKLVLTADDAKINIKEKNCLATGKVTLTHDEILFTCDKAFARWETESADIVGKINFKSKGNVTITADTATFNWKEKIADFYGKVKIKPDKNFKVDKNLKLGKGAYAHVRYNVVENKILQLDKNFKDPKITVPDFQ